MINFIFALLLVTAGIMVLVNEKYIVFCEGIWILYSTYKIYKELKKESRSIITILFYLVVLIVTFLLFIKLILWGNRAF